MTTDTSEKGLEALILAQMTGVGSACRALCRRDNQTTKQARLRSDLLDG